MSRRLKIATVEMGFLELFLIYQNGPTYEPDWLPLQGTFFDQLFSSVSEATMKHALRGWTRPLMAEMGLPPEGCLRKVPASFRDCVNREGCPFYDKVGCLPTSKKLPTCYQPGGVADGVARQLAHEAVFLWREGVQILVVTHE